MNRTLLAGLLVPVTGLAAGAAIYAAGRDGHTTTPAAASHRQQAATAEQAVLVSPKTSAPYANKTETGYLTSYADGTLSFRTATWVSGGVDNGHYDVGTRTHSLPLASDPTIRSAVGICSNGQVTMDRNGNADKACSPAQLAAALHSGNRPYAVLHVDSAGEITSILERYVP